MRCEVHHRKLRFDCWLLFVFVLILGINGTSLETQAAKKDGWSGGYYYVDGKKQTSKWIKDGG